MLAGAHSAHLWPAGLPPCTPAPQPPVPCVCVQVLFVFDGHYTDGEVIDVQSLTSKVTDELQNMLSSMTNTVGDMRTNLFSGLQLPLQSVGSKA